MAGVAFGWTMPETGSPNRIGARSPRATLRGVSALFDIAVTGSSALSRLIPNVTKAGGPKARGEIESLTGQLPGSGFQQNPGCRRATPIRGHRLNRPTLASLQVEQERAEERVAQNERGTRLLNAQ